MSDFLAMPTTGTPTDPAGWWVCAEESGQRVLWDGGITAKRAPWASPRAKGKPTGFWSMAGTPVEVRKRLYHYLPPIPLEGVLTKRGEFSVSSCPPLDAIFRTRRIGAGWEIDYYTVKSLYDREGVSYLEGDPVDSEMLNMATYMGDGPVYLRHHVKLPMNNSVEALNHFIKVANRRKSRAVWLRLPRSIYTPGVSPYFRRVVV